MTQERRMGGGLIFSFKEATGFTSNTRLKRKDEAKHLKHIPKPKLRGKDSRRNRGKSHLIMAVGDWLVETFFKDLEAPSGAELGIGRVLRSIIQKWAMYFVSCVLWFGGWTGGRQEVIEDFQTWVGKPQTKVGEVNGRE